jgi:ADP-ribose pyrophosphatase
MSTHPSLSRWDKGKSRLLSSTRILDLTSVEFRHPAREAGREFIVIHAPDWVNVIAVTVDRRLVLVRQFRYGIDDFSTEIPGGVIEPGEDPLAAGLRELLEETGYAGERARIIGSVYPNPAIQDNRCHFVLVENVAKVRAVAWDSDEDLECLLAPVEEVLDWARTGRIRHALVVGALMHYEGLMRGETASGNLT